jgi:hypothetical protein
MTRHDMTCEDATGAPSCCATRSPPMFHRRRCKRDFATYVRPLMLGIRGLWRGALPRLEGVPRYPPVAATTIKGRDAGDRRA